MNKAKEYFKKEYGKDHIKTVIELKDEVSIYGLMEEYSQLQTREDVSQKTKIEISKVIQDIADGKVHPSTGSARLMIILKQSNNKVDALIVKYEKELFKLRGRYDVHTNSLNLYSELSKLINKCDQFIQDLKQIKL